LISEAELLSDFGRNRKVLAEVIGVFLVDAPKYLDVIRRTSVSNGPMDDVEMAAAVHALKGSVGLFSGAACDVVRTLEQAIKTGNSAAVEAGRESVESVLARLSAELETIRRKLVSGLGTRGSGPG
jgi:HPt (histidine-containing phosphotransfer) domain-containing protein